MVDEDNNVVGSVPRSQLVAGRLLGRGVYCVVLNAAGDVFVSKRADSKVTVNQGATYLQY